MLRESHIPLFLWIATAVLAHLMFAGGADRASALIEEKLELRDFARQVQRYVADVNGAIEVALLDEPWPASKPDLAEPEPYPEEVREPTLEEPEPEPEPPEPSELAPTPEPEPRQVPKPEEDKKKPSLDKQPPQILELRPDRRIAVRQHVKDKNQEDNPDAEFIGDEANRVREQTQARITSTDQDDPNPTPGGQHRGPGDQPGNSDETRVGQSDDAPGDPDRTPTPLAEIEPPRVASITPPKPRPRPGSPRRAPVPPPEEARPGQSAEEAKTAVEGRTRPLTSPDGTWSVGAERVAQAERSGRKAREKPKRRLPRRRSRRPEDMLGLGATGLTENGVNLNLTPQDAYAAVGRDRLYRERHADGERRRSQHRGSWRSLGIERWRSAIENYVPHVRPGNQTALNTARVPFASYLNAVHNRIHPVFADTFLVSLNSLPSHHPLNQMEISTHLEIVLSSVDGSLVKMGVTKTSGVTAFDIGALESVQRASPFGAPPKQIISPDGNVYFHWEFHRNPYYACSTYFARPYILKTKPKQAPPAVKPPMRNPFRPREGPPPDGASRHG